MSLVADRLADLSRLDASLIEAAQPDHALFVDIILSSYPRLAAPKSDHAARLHRLLEAGAWTDAALELLALELPGWIVRRLACEEGKWHCSLSRHADLPIEMDDCIDAVHDVLPLAILRAFIEARLAAAATGMIETSVPRLAPMPELSMCCENFA